MKKVDIGVITVLVAVAVLTILLVIVLNNQPHPPTPRFTPSPSISSTATAVADACDFNGQVYCVLNPNVRQDTIMQTICVSGWTATIRPPVSYTNPLKWQQMVTEGFASSTADAQAKAGNYEEDHRMPLEGGGAPSDPSNLSPELHPGSFTKDAAENQMKADVCSGRKTLIQAQIDFIKQFLAPYPGYT